MKITRILVKCVALLFVVNVCVAQTEVVNVWADGIPGAIDNPEVKEKIITTEYGSERIANVINPTLKVYTPTKVKANGTAVLVCPGGGYVRLAMDKEGDSVAVWLNSLGVTAFVLKYRLPDDKIMEDKSVGPLEDAQEAMRLIRRNADKWGVDPNRIGVMGFSAGGHLASTLSTHFDEKVYDSDGTSARPDFSILIYPVVSMKLGITHNGSRESLLGKEPSDELVEHFSNELQVNESTPPAFLVHAQDDGAVPVENSINYFLALKQYKVPGELHLYQKGGHGFGLARNNAGETETAWPEACESWLKMSGLLK